MGWVERMSRVTVKSLFVMWGPKVVIIVGQDCRFGFLLQDGLHNYRRF